MLWHHVWALRQKSIVEKVWLFLNADALFLKNDQERFSGWTVDVGQIIRSWLINLQLRHTRARARAHTHTHTHRRRGPADRSWSLSCMIVSRSSWRVSVWSVSFDWREACLPSWCNRKHYGRVSQRYRFESRRGQWALFSLISSALSFVFLWHASSDSAEVLADAWRRGPADRSWSLSCMIVSRSSWRVSVWSVSLDWREACLPSWCNRKHYGRVSQRYRFESRRGQWALFSLISSALSFVFLWHASSDSAEVLADAWRRGPADRSWSLSCMIVSRSSWRVSVWSVSFDWREACLPSWCNRKHYGRVSQRYRFESRRGQWALFSLVSSALSFVFLWHTHVDLGPETGRLQHV